MYIAEFWCGVIAAVGAEVIGLIVAAVIMGRGGRK